MVKAITYALAGIPLVESLSVSAELDIGITDEDLVSNIKETRKCRAEDKSIATS